MTIICVFVLFAVAASPLANGHAVHYPSKQTEQGYNSWNRKRAVPTPTIQPDKEIIGCSATQNQPQTGRLATKLNCQALRNWALYLASNTSACYLGQASTSFIGTCDNYNSRVNSLYLEFEVGKYRVVAANGIPYHSYRFGAKQTIPNVACEYYKVMIFTKTPTKSGGFADTNMGTIGIARTGTFIFNHKSAEAQCNAAAITEAATFDSCGGHASPFYEYHYHLLPPSSCAFAGDCQLVGYLYDGFPVYSYCNGYRSCYELKDKTTNNTSVVTTNGRQVTIFNGCSTNDYQYNAASLTAGSCHLDQANGRDYNGQYSYFITPNYPFVMPQMAGWWWFLCSVNPN